MKKESQLLLLFFLERGRGGTWTCAPSSHVPTPLLQEMDTVTLPEKKERARIASVFFSKVVRFGPRHPCYTKIAIDYTTFSCEFSKQFIFLVPVTAYFLKKIDRDFIMEAIIHLMILHSVGNDMFRVNNNKTRII